MVLFLMSETSFDTTIFSNVDNNPGGGAFPSVENNVGHILFAKHAEPLKLCKSVHDALPKLFLLFSPPPYNLRMNISLTDYS